MTVNVNSDENQRSRFEVRESRPPRQVKRVMVWLLMLLLVAASVTGCGGDDEPAATDLIGTWVRSNGVTWRIEDDMIFVTGGAVDSFVYSATDTTIELIDKACGEELPGTYEWEIADDVLSLELVADGCQGRDTGLGGSSLERTE